MQLQSKKEKNQVESLPNLKDGIHRKPFTRKEKMDNLKFCIDKIQSLKDSKNKKNDLKSKHDIKSKFDASNDKVPIEKKTPGKRGRKKKIIDS